jgi:hypothetical protein
MGLMGLHFLARPGRPGATGTVVFGAETDSDLLCLSGVLAIICPSQERQFPPRMVNPKPAVWVLGASRDQVRSIAIVLSAPSQQSIAQIGNGGYRTCGRGRACRDFFLGRGVGLFGVLVNASSRNALLPDCCASSLSSAD